MTKNNYTYKEIFLGLRPEFLEVKEMLDELKTYSIANPRFVKDYSFFLTKLMLQNTPELMVQVERNYCKFMQILIELRKKLGYHMLDTSLMVKNNSSIYYPLSNDKNKLGVNPKYYELFNELVREILNSDFANEINFNIIPAINGCNISDICIKWYNLYLRIDALDKSSILSYNGRNDTFGFNGANRALLTKDYLEYLLSQEFPKQYFPNYHQQKIDEHLDDNTIILLDDDFVPSTSAALEIEDNNQELILRRIPKNK